MFGGGEDRQRAAIAGQVGAIHQLTRSAEALDLDLRRARLAAAPVVVLAACRAATAAPFAITNPIYVDADGNGFDKPPFNPTRPKVMPIVKEPPGVPVKSPEEIPERWHRAVHVH